MTDLKVAFVDVYVLRGTGEAMQCLVLQRAPGRSRPGSWEAVHAHIDPGEQPKDTALRELAEETGLTAERLYNLSRVETFYLHEEDEVVLIPVFAAFVGPEAEVRLSDEHIRSEWLPLAAAGRRFTWPREQRALEDIRRLLHRGHADTVEDVLRVC